MILNPGDVLWVEFGSPFGTEQAGRRPALVLSDDNYHRRARRVLVCPITRNLREWTFHVPIPAGLAVEGVVMVDQVRMIDRDVRMFDHIGKLPPETLVEVLGKLSVLMNLSGVNRR